MIPAFAVMAAYWPTIYGAGTAPRMMVLAVVVPAALFFVRIAMTDAHWWFLGAVLYASMTLSWGLVPTEGVRGLWWLILMFGAFCLGAATKRMEPIYIGAGIGIALSAVAVGFQMVGKWPWDQVVGPSGLFVNKNFLAEAAAVTAVGLLLSRRWFLGSVALLCVIVAKSKGAWNIAHTNFSITP